MGQTIEANDRTLLAQIAQRDAQALGALYDRYGALLYRLSLHITDDHGLAETVVHMVFEATWQSAHRLQRTVHVRPWLIALARQHALAMAQRCDLEGQKEATAREPVSAIDDEETADTVVEPGAVQAALQALLPHQRTILEYAYYRGQTCATIAGHLGQPIAMVKAELRQAVATLQACLGRERKHIG
jgi:RNA polymerase sigma-70 factor (ECF subfamily)